MPRACGPASDLSFIVLSLMLSSQPESAEEEEEEE